MTILKGEQVYKRFGGLKALAGVDFELNEGEILGLIGPNGSGKTTLFNVISGFYRPEEGRVSYRGRDITGLRPDRVCRLGVGRTFQLIHPFKSLTVSDNIRVGAVFGKAGRRSGRQTEEKISQVLKMAGLEAKGGAAVESLTIGDLRHLELARALATEPDILLLDEVLAGLTPVETEELMSTIRAVRESGVTVFMIEHVMRAVMGLSDRVIVLEFGEKIAEGDPQAILHDDRVIRAYLGEADAT